MDLTAAWQSAFAAWPAELPRAGMLVTSGQETIPFVDFLLGPDFLIVERDKPDSQGARKLIVALAAITAVKLTTPEPLSSLQGFAAPKVEQDLDFPGAPDVTSRASAALRRTGDFSRRPL